MVIWRYLDDAREDLQRLDQKTARLIAKKIRFFCESEKPFSFAEPLTGEFKGFFRFRIGDYRVIFTRETPSTVVVLLIVRIDHRRDVYR